MNGPHVDRLTPHSTPRKATSRARSRATSSSSIITTAASSLHSTPIKVPVTSSTSKPQVSDDYANANLCSGDEEAVPQLERAMSDLSLASDTSPDASSPRSSPRERIVQNYTNDPDAPLSFPDLTRQSLFGSITQRRPLGSRRSTISASATTTSLNLEIADPVTVCAARKGAADLLFQAQVLERKAGAERVDDRGLGASGRRDVSPASIRKRRNREVAAGSRRQEKASAENDVAGQEQVVKTDPVTNKQHLVEDRQRLRPSSYPERRYFILTSAGKPVFCSHTEDEESLTRMMGVAQAIISIYDEDSDKLQSITHGRTKITFLLGDPLYLFCVSDWKEPDFVLRNHLDYLYLQTISIVTNNQLVKMFQRRSNFDLRRLLDGSEPFLHNLISQLQFDFAFFTSSLQPLRMSPFLREAAASALVPPTKISNLLYVLLVVDNKIVTLLRPRKHSIHPTDLHLLLNVLSASPALRTSETWLPICLPKFNPDGFVYAFISYIRPEVGLVFVSADKEGFEPLREWRDGVVKKLEHAKVLSKIENAHLHHEYSLSDLEVPGVRHFWYKSKSNVQITMPRWEQPYVPNSDDQKRLITLYQHIYDGIHAKSGRVAPLKQYYVRTEFEACMGWSTTSFELYLTLSPEIPKHSAVSAANAIARWIGKEESRLFLRDAPVF